MFLRISISLVCACLLFVSVAWAGEILTVRDFERSEFSKAYGARTKNSWALRSGGTNFSYSYADSESDSRASVEMSPDVDRITHYGVSWHGESKQQPAALTRQRETFLRKLLAAVSDQINVDRVVTYVKSNQRRRYPHGLLMAPKQRIGILDVRAGVGGSSLIVVFDKTK